MEEEGLKSGHLTLRHLSPKHDGLYTCEVDTDEETHVSSTFLTVEEPDKGGGSHRVQAALTGRRDAPWITSSYGHSGLEVD